MTISGAFGLDDLDTKRVSREMVPTLESVEKRDQPSTLFGGALLSPATATANTSIVSGNAISTSTAKPVTPPVIKMTSFDGIGIGGDARNPGGTSTSGTTTTTTTSVQPSLAGIGLALFELIL